jgi:hypothetical protein
MVCSGGVIQSLLLCSLLSNSDQVVHFQVLRLIDVGSVLLLEVCAARCCDMFLSVSVG